MKTLYIVRHAKSSWDQAGLADHQRPLLEKGKKRTKLITDYLLENNIKADLIISSHAVRALETARMIGNALNYPVDEIQISTNIYHGDIDNLFDLFYDLSDDIESIMIVGHNPTITTFANYFLDEKIEWLSTSGVVCVEFNANKWDNVMDSEKEIKFMITPKLIKARKKQKK